MSFLRLIFFLAVVSLDLLAPSPILPHPRFSAYNFLFKVGMSLLKFIVFLAVVSLDLLVPSTFFAYPRFSAYIFSVK